MRIVLVCSFVRCLPVCLMWVMRANMYAFMSQMERRLIMRRSAIVGDQACHFASRQQILTHFGKAYLSVHFQEHFSMLSSLHGSWEYGICGLTHCASFKITEQTGKKTR